MLLAVDIGNTNITVGVFKGAKLLAHWRISTSKERTSDEYGVILAGLIKGAEIRLKELKGVIVASVVPYADEAFTRAVVERLKIAPLFVGDGIKARMRVLTDKPEEVGADRIVNAVGAYGEHKKALIVVDFGTAVTFDYVTKDGCYAGGVIAPGVLISAEALSLKTARLPRVEPVKPAKVIGRNTVECMRSGLYWGFVGLVDGIIAKMLTETKGKPKIVATGGLARLIAGESAYITSADEFLTLKGLRMIFEGRG